MRLVFTTLCLLTVGSVFAQFAVGHHSAAFNDPSRSRSITCEIYYPAATAGDDVPVADGTFPFIAFGHGFVMNYTAYQNITDALVAGGYVMIYLEMEGGFAPVHADFGLDLAFVADHFFEENATAGSLFQSHLIDRCAIMGHSMGGGATWLAASTSESVDCIAGLAPAETSPSAIAAASNVNVPAIVFSGSSDAVTPPADNHIPIFEGTASTCKIFVNILNGSHCGYANSGSLCDFGELGFAGLSREEQQVIAQEMLRAFFDLHLKELNTGNIILQNYDNLQPNTETQIDCTVQVGEWNEMNRIALYPNPCADELTMECDSHEWLQYMVVDITGEVVSSGRLQLIGQRATIHTGILTAGMYVLQLNDRQAVRFVRR